MTAEQDDAALLTDAEWAEVDMWASYSQGHRHDLHAAVERIIANREADLRQRVEVVLTIHRPRLVTAFAGPEAGIKTQVCSHCEMTEPSWPCPTVAALTTGADRG